MKSGRKKNHRRKGMQTVVSLSNYNNALHSKSVAGSIAFLDGSLQRLLHLEPVVAVTACAVCITIPQEGPDKPDKKQQRYNNGHDHVADLVAQVHKHAYDVKSLGKRKDAYHSLKKEHQEGIGCVTLVHGVQDQTDGQLNDRDDGQNDRGFTDPSFKLGIIGVMVKSYFG